MLSARLKPGKIVIVQHAVHGWEPTRGEVTGFDETGLTIKVFARGQENATHLLRFCPWATIAWVEYMENKQPVRPPL